MAVLIELKNVAECLVRRRINRFTVMVQVGDENIPAYINNTGRLHEYLDAGRRGFCIPKSRGKLRLRLIAVEDKEGAALIDTRMQMRGFEEAVARKLIPWMKGCRIAARNPRTGSSVLDYLARCGETNVWIEVKSAAMRGERGYAMYPDCPSLRGRRHISELIALASKGERTMIVFIAAIPGARGFTPYVHGDPIIARLLARAVKAGVEARALSMYFEPRFSAIVLDNPSLPVRLPGLSRR